MAKIIDILFPIVPLPKDKKERNAVIEGYEKRLPASGSISGLLLVLPFLILGTFSVSNGFSSFNASICVCALLPTLFYFIGLIFGVYCKLMHGTATIHAKHAVAVYGAFAFSISLVNVIFGYLHLGNLLGNKYIVVDTNTYIIIYAILAVTYYIGYWYYLLKFNGRMTGQGGSLAKKGLGVTGGLVGYFLARHISFYLCFLIVFICLLYVAFYFSSPLVDYRQYNNIQRAKKGMTFK